MLEKLPLGFPVTKNLIRILKHFHLAPNVEMKMICYICSMITACFEGKPEGVQDEANNYNKGINRFVATILAHKSKSVSMMPHCKFITTLTTRKKIM